MIATTVPGILHRLCDPRLLSPERYDELVTRLLPQCSDWNIIGPELVYRGWFTPFQMGQILRGNASSLILGSYTLLEPLGQGGMGSVYRAQNWRLGKTVAVKVIRSEQVRDRRVVRRFVREIQALGRISHPNIVLAFDADIDQNRLFYAMEYIPGRDLGWKVRESGPFTLQAVCYFTAQIAHALQHVHESGLVHRDIKPSNLLLTQNELSVKLLDLGLSRGEATDLEGTQLTQVGSLIGTPDYIAPEQVQDPHRVDIRADLYSLGCTLYYLLAGRAPFEDAQTVEKLYLHANEDPRPIQSIRPDLPAPLAAIVQKLMAKQPRKRYQEPAELLMAILPLLQSSWDANAPTVNDRASLTGLHVPPGSVCDPAPRTPAPDSSSADPFQTQLLTPSQLEIHLPETLNTLVPAALRQRSIANEWWFRPLQMGIAILLATVAMIALQVVSHPRKGGPLAPAATAAPEVPGAVGDEP